MGKDNLNLNYQGWTNKNRATADEAGNIQGLSKKQRGHAEALLGKNKGALANQSSTGSNSTANALTAGANHTTVNATNVQRFVKETGRTEEATTHNQAGVSRQMESTANEIMSKANKNA